MSERDSKVRLELDRILNPYDGTTIARFVCELPGNYTQEPSIKARSAIGLPLVGEPVVVRDVYEYGTNHDWIRKLEISVVIRHRMFGVRLEVSCEHEGEVLQAQTVLSRSDLYETADRWLEDRRNASNWDGYDAWMRQHQASEAEIAAQNEIAKQWEQEGFSPLVSVVVPVFQTPAAYLKQAIDSVLRQSYPHFELILINVSGDYSEVDNALAPYITGSEADSRIRLIATANKSIAENTNVGINLAHGDYVCFIDHDDFLEPDALFRYMEVLHEHPETDLLYCNEDKFTDDSNYYVRDVRVELSEEEIAETSSKDLSGGGVFFSPVFKGAWDFDRLLDGNTVCHMLMVSKRSLDLTTRTPAELSGAQDYDLTLKVAERARAIKHVPFMLYHWRSHESSTATNQESKPYAHIAGQRAIEEHFQRTATEASLGDVDYPFSYRTYYGLPKPAPKASVVVVASSTDEAAACTTRILAVTSYENYEVIVVAPDEDVLDLAAGRVRAVSVGQDSSWTMRANFGCERATGDVLVVCDGRTIDFSPEWLTVLIERQVRPDVAISAPTIVNRDALIDSNGLSITESGHAVRMSNGLSTGDTGYMQFLLAAHTVSAVSHACFAIQRETFENLGGLDERFATGVSVHALCLRARESGLASVVLPYAPVTWAEICDERESEDMIEDEHLLVDVFPTLRDADPMLDPALSRTSPYYQLPEQLA